MPTTPGGPTGGIYSITGTQKTGLARTLIIGDSIPYGTGASAFNLSYRAMGNEEFFEGDPANFCAVNFVGNNHAATLAESYPNDNCHAWGGSKCEDHVSASFDARGTGVRDVASDINPTDARFKPIATIISIGINNLSTTADVADALSKYKMLLDYIYSLDPALWNMVTTVTPSATVAKNDAINLFNTGLTEVGGIWDQVEAGGMIIWRTDANSVVTTADLMDTVHFGDVGQAKLYNNWYRPGIFNLYGYAEAA